MQKSYFKRKHFKLICLILILLMFLYNLNLLNCTTYFLNKSEKHLITCYFRDKHPNSLLDFNPNEVTKNSIFFFETSCNHEYGITLNLRQGCAIESAAKLNPNLKIFVLFLASNFVNNKSDVINKLHTYSNVNLRHINFVKFADKTPLQHFVTSNTIFKSYWPVSHASDLLRFLTLWKFGGTYLDLDIVLMKSLEGITNFVTRESTTSIGSFVLNFDVDKIGRTIANLTIHEFAYNYRGYDWGYNGPGVITRTFQKVCNTNVITDMNKQTCKGFMVFGPEAFCPVNWKNWHLYFDANKSEEIMIKIKDSIGIHLWNLHSQHTDIIVGLKQPYGLVAKEYCPTIFSLAKYAF